MPYIVDAKPESMQLSCELLIKYSGCISIYVGGKENSLRSESVLKMCMPYNHL